MIQVTLSNEILRRISAIDENRFSMNAAKMPTITANRLRKNSKKKSAYASNRIEGNPLTESQADTAIEKDAHKHFLKPEQEVRNYFMALEVLEQKCKQQEPLSMDLILQIQALVEKGASKEKIGLRGAMPPGVLFAVYDTKSGAAEYIPPDYQEVPTLLEELVRYVNTTDDHPLLVAAVVHYQLVTIHPFEDGNGRTARLLSGYVLDLNGYGFQGIGSLEEYFAYDPEEYYRSLQMGLPTLYYDGRENPPHPEIWIHYFLQMVELYSSKVCALSQNSQEEGLYESLSHLKPKETALLQHLLEHWRYEFTPVEVSKAVAVSNKTIINRCVRLAAHGFVIPVIVKERIRSYKLSPYAIANRERILEICKENENSETIVKK